MLDKFHKACQNIVDNRTEKALNWAVNYAAHGLNITHLVETKFQAFYILNNMTHWRGGSSEGNSADVEGGE